MLNSLSRGPSRVRPSYICTSCLNSIAQRVDVQFPGKDHQHGSSTPLHVRHAGTGKLRRPIRPSRMSMSRSKDTLSALKKSLLEDDEPKPSRKTKSTAETKQAKEGIKEAEPKPSGVEKSSADAKKVKGTTRDDGPKPPGKKKSPTATEKAKGTIRDEGQKPKKGKGLPKAAVKSQKGAGNTKAASGTGALLKTPKQSASEKANEALTKERLSKPLKKGSAAEARKKIIESRLVSRAKTKKRSSAVVRRIESRTSGEKSVANLDNASREDLVRIIKSQELPPDKMLEAVKKLRASLINRVPSSPANTPESSSIAVRMMGSRSFKEGVASSQTPVSRRWGRRLGLASNTTNVNQSGPRPAKVVRTGPMKGEGFSVKTVSANELQLVPLEKSQEQVPSLSYGLERVLFNPGVYHLQDPRSRVFNFDPYLQTIMPVNEFDFNALKQYITSSRDDALLDIAREEKKKYTGSTSSMTAALAHFHFLLSQWRPVNTGMLSQNFPVEYNSFTALQRGPSAVFLRWKDGTYAIDADKQYDTANILSMLGKSMEKLLTLKTEDFEKYRKENSDQITEEERNEAETFHYSTIGDFLLRSQLDAYDSRLPGTGMFDLKTRAVVSIRMDTKQYEKGMGYEIRGRHGEWESYEREYYDMIRAAFLKYSLQVRMGRMDGIFVAFHNTERIFGFQYISLSEMDYALHGTDDTNIGDAEFKLSLELLNKVLDRATEKFPEKTLRLHFETRGDETPFMYIFAEPMEEPQVEEIQNANRATVLEFEARVLGLRSEEELLEEKKKAEWEILRTKVEEAMHRDEVDLQAARVVAESLLAESEYWDELEPEEKEMCIKELLESTAFNDSQEDEEGKAVPVDDGEENGDSETVPVDDGEEDDDSLGEENDADEDEEESNEDEAQEEEDEDIEEVEGVEEVEEVDEQETNNGNDEAEVENSLAESSIERTDGLDPGSADHAVGNEDIVNEALLDDPIVKDSAEEELMDDATAHEADNGVPVAEESVEDEPEKADLVQNENLLPNERSEGISKPDETTSDGNQETLPKPVTESSQESKPTVFAMTLTIRNLVNGEYVERPENLSKEDKWTVEYALADISPQRAETLYEACKKRRFQSLSFAKKENETPWNNAYLEKLRVLSQQGKAWREGQNEIDKSSGLKVLDEKDGKKMPLRDDWVPKDHV